MDSLKEARIFAQTVVDVLARAEEVAAMAATHEELTRNVATLTAQIEQKRETLAGLTAQTAERQLAVAELQARYGKLERLAELDQKIAEQTERLRKLNVDSESIRAKFAAL